MAKIKLSGLITDIRGSIGGTCFQNSASGFIMKNKPNTLSFITPRTNQHQNFIARLTYLYDSLSVSNKRRWDSAAVYLNSISKNGNGRLVNGKESFFSYNYYLLNENLSSISMPAYTIDMAAPYSLLLTRDGNDLYLSCSRSISQSSEFLVLFCTRPVPAGVSKPRNRLRLLSNIQIGGPGKYITASYENCLGSIPNLGDRIFVRSRRQYKNSIYFTPWLSETLIVD